jgi:hypothetical protein
MTWVDGVLAGMLAGVFMGLVSHVLYRTGKFESSLLIVDGTFLLGPSAVEEKPRQLYIVGTLLHVITSGFFGGAYFSITGFLKLHPVSPFPVTVYFVVLWLSMLCIALPVARQGIFGRKAGRKTWFEQMILHIIFGFEYYFFLRLMGG